MRFVSDIKTFLPKEKTGGVGGPCCGSISHPSDLSFETPAFRKVCLEV